MSGKWTPRNYLVYHSSPAYHVVVQNKLIDGSVFDLAGCQCARERVEVNCFGHEGMLFPFSVFTKPGDVLTYNTETNTSRVGA